MLFPCRKKRNKKQKISKRITLKQVMSHETIENKIETTQCRFGDFPPVPNYTSYKEKAPYTTHRLNASVTVEASLVMPLVIFAFALLMQIMIMINTVVTVQNALSGELLRLSGLSYFVNTAECELMDKLEAKDYQTVLDMAANGVTEALIKGLVERQLSDDFFEKGLIENGKSGLSFVFEPLADKSYYEVVLSYKLSPYYDIFGIGKLPIISRGRIKKWVGVTVVPEAPDNEAEKGDIVYITEFGSVYHMYKDCTYIKVSVSSTSFSDISTKRNASGGKYYACSSCMGNVGAVDTVYYTKYGDRFHLTSSCKKIYHNIIEVEKASVSDRRLCSKCRDRGEK